MVRSAVFAVSVLLQGIAHADLADLNAELTEFAIEEDDACSTDDSPEACALHLRALRGEAVRGAIMTDNQQEGIADQTASDPAEVKKLFLEMDTDHDGEVQAPELAAFLEANGAKEFFVKKAASLVELYDMKGSKGLNMQELDKALDTVYYGEYYPHRQYRPYSDQHAWLLELNAKGSPEADLAAETALFAAVDSNHDGAIQKSELESFLKTTNHANEAVLQKVPSLFAVHDMDSSHSLNLAEFGKALDTVSWWGGGAGGWHAGGWHAGGGGYGGGGWHGGGWQAGGWHGGGGGFGGWHGGGWHAGGFGGGGGYGGGGVGGWHAGGWHSGWLMQLGATESSIADKTDHEKASSLIALADSDSDGEVQSEEMQAFLDKAKVTSPMKDGAAKLITLFDDDQSKGLNLQEFQHALDTATWWAHGQDGYHHDSLYHHWLLQVNDTKAAQAIDEAETLALFAKVDSDNNGEVNQSEMDDFLKSIAESNPQQRVALLQVHDVDKSNGLNLQEFGKATNAVEWGYGHGYGYGSWGGRHGGGGWGYGYRRGGFGYGYGHHGYGWR
mmetsp:Transcript_5666/g.13310  ORF Transcript_5666/g.13310 Transcript_5666/m.13310 type:complete len:557 (+) Transcript_5666:50-1720(+)